MESRKRLTLELASRSTLARRSKTVSGIMEHRAQVPVECPQCHWRQFMEIEVDSQLLKSPVAFELKRHLEEWVKSRCPDHLGPIMQMSKN